MDIPMMYHGTAVASWRQSGEHPPLHLTSDRTEAVWHANERVGAWAFDDIQTEAIVLEFSPELLSALLQKGVVVRPGEGWLEFGVTGQQPKDKSWQASLRERGEIALDGFSDEMKSSIPFLVEKPKDKMPGLAPGA